MEESVRIVVLDFYMSHPIPGLDVTYSEFRSASINQVPILRCFGSTKSGEKICVHIHGVFPYLYIPYDGVGNAESLMYQIAANIDKAVNTSLNQGSSSNQHVYKISLVSGIPMYGYHPKKHQFFKIYLYNPMLVSTVTNLLLNHSILNKVFQPHEAHINFTLQFMIDYNLHGMSNMDITDMKYRVNLDDFNTNIDKEFFLPVNIERISTCELEGDINAENILNRQEIINGNLAVNPGIAALWADEQQRRRNKNEDSQLGQFLELKNMRFTPTQTHLIFQQALAERLAVLSTDTNFMKEGVSTSVYAAETPNDANIQNASLIDIHTPSSLELSLDDTINISSSQNLDATIVSTQGLNVTMNEDVNNFMQVLQALAEEKALENAKEEDSILSQTVKEDEPNDDSNEDFLDLSMPLAAVNTPMKVDTKDISEKSDDDDENYFDTTLVPQVDGQAEMSDSSDEEIFVYRTRSRKQNFKKLIQNDSGNSTNWTDKTSGEKSPDKPHCAKSMPLLDMNIELLDSSSQTPLDKINMTPIVKLHHIKPVVKIERRTISEMCKILGNHPRAKNCVKKTSEEKMEENLRLIRFRINRINNISELKRLKHVVHKKESEIESLLKRSLRPKFNIVSGRKWFLDSRQNDVINSPIISRILKQTHNYTYPTLHMLVKHSTNKKFLYYYGGETIPEITEIPPNLSESECRQIIFDTRKSKSPLQRKKDNFKRQKIKLLQNKILNIKPPKIGMNKEPKCEVVFANFPETLKDIVSQISKPLQQESHAKNDRPGKQENLCSKINIADLQAEMEEANLTLQRHIQYLEDFDTYIPFTKPKKVSLLDEKFGIFNQLKCFGNNSFEADVNESELSTFSFDAEDTCQSSTFKDVNKCLNNNNFETNRNEAKLSTFSYEDEDTCDLSMLKDVDKCFNNKNFDTNFNDDKLSTFSYEDEDSCKLFMSKDINKCLNNNFETTVNDAKVSTFKYVNTCLNNNFKTNVSEGQVSPFLYVDENTCELSTFKDISKCLNNNSFTTNFNEAKVSTFSYEADKICKLSTFIKVKKYLSNPNCKINVNGAKISRFSYHAEDTCELPEFKEDRNFYTKNFETNVRESKISTFSYKAKEANKSFNNNDFAADVNESKISTFSYEDEQSCELPTPKEVNNILGGIRNLKNVINFSGSDFGGTKCHLKILNSSNDKFDVKENVCNDVDITLRRSFERNKEPRLVSSKILSDIGNTNIFNFRSAPYNTANLKMPIYRSWRQPNTIGSSSDESDSDEDIFIENDNDPSCSPSLSPVKSDNDSVRGSMVVINPATEFKKNTNTPSVDSDYMSLSTNSSDKNTVYGFKYEGSPSSNSVSVDSHVESTYSLGSPKVLPRINIISDILLEKPLHVRCLKRSVSTELFGNDESSFGNGADFGVEIPDIIDQYKSKPIWDHTYTQCYVSKPIKKRRRSTPNIYINCDGAADSSSEDETKIRTRSKKRARRTRGLSQYAPLQISVSKSPRVRGNCSEAGLADDTTEISGNQANFQQISAEIDQKKSVSKSRISHKRKLNFESGILLNTTTSEEYLSCVYSPKNISKTCISTTDNNITVKISDKSDASQAEIADTDFDQTSDNSQSPNNSPSQQLESTYSDSDLFSEDEDMNKSFFQNYNLSVSEQYDKETKYNAKEGCSTIFTPNSFVSQGTVLSLKSSDSQIFSDSTSKEITPYQEVENVKTYKENSQIIGSLPPSENSSSDITPYQNFKQTGATTGKLKVLKAAFSAPTRSQVEASLNELKIPEVVVKEPFYSSVEDYTGVVEVGHNTLRIPSEAACHLPDFESDFDGIIKHRRHFTETVANLIWNSNNLKNLKLNYCSNRKVIIRPIKKPPSLKDVQLWLETNSKEKETSVTPEDKNRRAKIYIPNSPGHDQDDLELSLTITPCTPPSQGKLVQSSEPGTPKSSLNSESSSPILDHRKKKCKKKNLTKMKPLSLRESLLHCEEINKSCQITGISQNDSFGFSKSVQNLQAARVVLEYQHLTTMVMELHIRTRGDFKPDPEYDSICAIFYSILNDVPETCAKKSKAKGVIAVNCLPMDMGKPNEKFLDGICKDCDITYADNEEALINSFLSLIKYWDPDIFAGYEIQMLSWGYLIDRAFVLSLNIIPLLGRSQINKYGRTKQQTTNYEIESAITGRIVLDVWRLMRHEIALQSYTFESIVYHILHKRVPMFAFKHLTFWWDHRTSLYRHRVVSYYLLRVQMVLELFDKLDFLNRTSELARLFGILFYEVLSRGSQFRVESMMLRLAKPLNYVPVSPSQAQRARMKAPEYIALVMEPESKLYNDPVIVLDFQSLYPSIIIAYNYCFTTCVGRVNLLGTNSPYEFGATQLKVPRKIVEKLSKKDLLNFSPCGVAYVKQKVRQGILPRMLTEILDTRLMVKNSMKENKENSNLQKVLHNRQLGLKLIANVTYGYTAANFSGRMCCVEVGDSVVSKARETLQRAIALVESTTEWGARVVYGDTDSLFVLVPGKTKETAFEVGKKIADAITADNPDPVKLKLEKVYQPCILQTKKRYVGYMYESPDQKEPVYDAKGIETVRRDGCPAVSKMLQKCLTLLFETKDVSLIKKYILRQFNKIQAGRANIQDLTFAKEYRGASGYKPGACVPALELARKWKAVDRRSEPRSGERVPYVIVNGPPGLPLIRLVKSPRDLLNDSSLRPNGLYYITKVIIPPINRCLNLIGADLHTWYNQMPRKNTQYLPNSSPIVKSTISQYFVSKICASCSRPTQNGLCDRCCQNVNVTAFTLAEKLRRWEENFHNTKLICHSCTGHVDEITCISLDCPVLYRRTQTYNDLQQSSYVRELLATTDIFSENSIFDD